ncbi:ubiquitin carboxyl-terminal hydrolase 36-like [Frankliniella occidentalis]|uniref:Ubiquitin carboxyl-terminal hydrolase 36 n=1 Tax=Frankliniella occidentalis TaxID=133901 RepID=A0A9C6WUU9_FRAOC|nr:ubiquitin carboxyl-terminal hydrolase 36-like [Frankliniella occidentalis]
MKNQGNTCYINAALQALFHIPAFVSLVLEDQRHRDNCTLKKNNTCLMCSVAETLIRSHQSSLVVPVRIYNQLPMIHSFLKRGRQEDSHEFLTHYLDKLDEEYLKRFPISQRNSNNSATSPIKLIFQGHILQEVTCLNCKGVSKSIQSISDLNVVLQDSVLQAISVYFQPSKLVGYKCQNCRSQSGAYKASSIINPPNVLVITLNRFQAQTGAKINSPCKVDPTLDLKKFYKGNKDGCRYKFLACVNHHGPGAKRGHYTCLAVAANGSTYEFDDEKVSPVQNSSADDNVALGSYFIFYEKQQNKLVDKK